MRRKSLSRAGNRAAQRAGGTTHPRNYALAVRGGYRL